MTKLKKDFNLNELMKTPENDTPTWILLQEDLKKAVNTWEDIQSHTPENLQTDKDYQKYKDLFQEIESKIKDLS